MCRPSVALLVPQGQPRVLSRKTRPRLLLASLRREVAAFHPRRWPSRAATRARAAPRQAQRRTWRAAAHPTGAQRWVRARARVATCDVHAAAQLLV